MPARLLSIAVSLVGLVPLVVAVWATRLYAEFTPIFKGITCRISDMRLDGPLGLTPLGLALAPPGQSAPHAGQDGGLDLSIHMALACSNPNPYDITVRASTREHDVTYVGENRTAVASLLELPRTALHRRTGGTLEASVTISTSQGQITELLPTLLGSAPVPIEMTLAMGADLDVRFFLREWKISQTFLKDCGLTVQNVVALALGQPGGKMSTMVCGNSFEALQLPSVSDLHPVSEGLHISGGDIAPASIAEGTVAKDVGLGALMALCYLAFLACLACACCCCGSGCSTRTVTRNPSPQRAGKDPCVEETAAPDV